MAVKRNDIELPKYDGVIETWKVKLAVSRIRAFRLPKDEWEDALQDIAIAILQFRFDPTKANGAKESTALCSLINNILRMTVRLKERDRRRLDKYASGQSHAFDQETGEPIAEDSPASLRMDVAAAVKAMTSFERSVCTRLCRGDSMKAIAKQLRCDRGRIRRTVATIRRRMRQAGIDGWLHA
jgi:RNA polymerase sigma factor (sigma-70 family)